MGYAAIQESFEEAVCIKITALMANVALIAPLLGPLVGAAWVHVLPWEMMFVLFAVLAAISFSACSGRCRRPRRGWAKSCR